LRYTDFGCKISVNFNTDLLSHDVMALIINYGSIEINLCFSGKMCSDGRKNHGCGQKNLKALALLYLTSGLLPNDANSSNILPPPQAFPRPSKRGF